MQLTDLLVVQKIAELQSITAAAASLDLRVATASAALKRVEKNLGCELFIRTTRQLRLSAAGELYLPQCRQALSLLDQASQQIKGEQGTVDGELRIAVSSDLGRNRLIPWMDEFMSEHPQIRLRTHVSDSNIDFYRDSVDLALRYGSPDEANLYGFKICDVPKVLCAAPAYIRQYGQPAHPHELAAHNALCYQLSDILHDVWEFTDGDGQLLKVKVRGNRAANDGDLVRRWCVAGQGMAIKSCLDMSEDLLAGRVEALMMDYPAPVGELWLICPSRQLITPAVRLLRDMLQQRCQHLLTELAAQGLIRGVS